jgi:TatD DNase family protein
MFTDSHCHLADSTLASRLPEVLADARKNQVHRFIVPAAEAQEWPAVLALAATDIHPALGIHPWFADKAAFNRLPELETYLQQHPELLIGEIGLDYKQCLSENGRELQRRLLSQQLELACRYQRPVILHNLQSSADLLALLKQHQIHRGIVHAFSGSLEEAHAFIRQGLLIGIGSLLLNPNAKKACRAAAELPLTSIVLETDSPFMLPDKGNTPANLFKIANIVAELRGIELAELAAQTEQNIDKLLAT